MSNTMEVDAKLAQQLQLSVHPLAIVNMSDHFTRITCGGSPLDPTAPVVGLLFGKTEMSTGSRNSQSVVQILDSDDIPVTADATTQVSLHQAVFPQHAVVGWYRVAAAAGAAGSPIEPTAHDLQITAQLQKRYGTTILFLLLAAPVEPDSHAPQKQPASSCSEITKTDPDDDALPLQLYQLAETQQSFISLEQHWSLQTFEPERIAIEHVVRAQPLRLRRAATTPQQRLSSSAFTERGQDVYHSWHMLQQRLTIVEGFLEDTVAGRIPRQPALLRHVQGLLWQLGPLAATLVSSNTDLADLSSSKKSRADLYDDASFLVQQLAVLAKTVDAVQSYAEKFRMVNEASSSSNRPMRGDGPRGSRASSFPRPHYPSL